MEVVAAPGLDDGTGDLDGFRDLNVGTRPGKNLEGDGSAAAPERVARPSEAKAFCRVPRQFPQNLLSLFGVRWGTLGHFIGAPVGNRRERLHQVRLGDGAPRSRGFPNGTDGINQSPGPFGIAREDLHEAADLVCRPGQGIDAILNGRIDEAPADVDQRQLELATLRPHGTRADSGPEPRWRASPIPACRPSRFVTERACKHQNRLPLKGLGAWHPLFVYSLYTCLHACGLVLGTEIRVFVRTEGASGV